ncbi:hypothetical protein VE01_05567 [Pseudogymnoascus verrucosus]|uniref:Enoyl reductase (ER) domain-containing protein n=1 Tax=Pseudogymnoascus verrucosus TaxID=342668 RepID=A0A1B8GM63_9PEZI|nr:uncharacterized protein VE01_05567 [Pseudogymnoascus verrucosus]OBT96896.1 hypothetical protein VE01_05567 [Pseudogymnoascus verrucosus]
MAEPTMRAVGVSAFAGPAKYEHLILPIPTITGDEDILVRVKATSLAGPDVARAAGTLRIVQTIKLPVIIGSDFAGTIAAVGSAVTAFRPGDRVFGFTVNGGGAAEYLLLKPHRMLCLAKLPDNISFEDASYFPSTSLTIIQALDAAEAAIPGGLKGKTVFIPAGLSATGSLALQLLKPVYDVKKVITTVSTAKVSRIIELFGEGKVDQTIDYTTQNVVEAIGPQTVDFMLDTCYSSMKYIQIMKPGTGILYTLTGKKGADLREDFPTAPWLVAKILDVANAVQTWRVSRWGVAYKPVFTKMSVYDLQRVGEWAQSGTVKAIVGDTADLADLERVKALATVVEKKNGLGKYIITIE